MMNWLKNRCRERSTWLGIATLISIAGYELTDMQKNALIEAGMAVSAFVAIIWSEKK
jgi:hypothetical protein